MLKGFIFSTAVIIVGLASPSLVNADESVDLSDAAHNYIGEGYALGGDNPDEGFNTVGFVSYLLNEHKGYNIPSDSSQLKHLGDPVQKEEVASGDLLFFEGSSYPIPGVYVGDDRFIIATSSDGIAERSFQSSSFWGPRFKEAVRVGENNVFEESDPALKEALSVLGVPQQNGGSSIETGFNTSGMVSYAFEQGKDLPLPSNSQDINAIGQEVERSDLKPGDVVFFQGSSGLLPGVYAGNERIVFTTTSRGVALEHMERNKYFERNYSHAVRMDHDNEMKNILMEHLGDPYQVGGSTPEEGFNTTGFASFALSKDFETPVDVTDTFLKTQAETVTGERQTGDIIYFQGSSSVITGVYYEDERFVIANHRDGVTFRSLEQSYYSERYIETKRIKENQLDEADGDVAIKEAVNDYLNDEKTMPSYEDGNKMYAGDFVQKIVYESKDTYISRRSEVQKESGEPIALQDIEIGDIVVFDCATGNCNTSGIYMGDGEFARFLNGEVDTRNLFSNFYEDLIVGVYRYTEEELAPFQPETYEEHSNELVRESMTHYETPYKVTGEQPGVFLDCSYFLKTVYEDAGDIYIPRITYNQHEVGEKIPRGEAEPGDALFFENTYKEGISHVGIYLGNDFMIHASGEERMTAITHVGDYWNDHFVDVRRYEDIGNDPVAAKAVSLFGVDQSFGGQTPDEGFSRAGYTSYVYEKALGESIPSTNQALYDQADKIDIEDVRIGDIVFFEGSSSPLSSIYVGNEQVAMVTNKYGVRTIDTNNSNTWSEKIIEAGRYR